MNKFQINTSKNKTSNSIKVIGIGGGGGNAVNHMFEQGIDGVDFIICNTDSQALNNSPVTTKIQLGTSITEGLGAGADPEVGEKAALESLEEIKNIFDINTKMVFITAGMGGGTGTGAAPIISSVSKELGILTVGIVTVPFYFEGCLRLEQAQKGIKVLREKVDSLIVINNDKLRELYGNLGFKSGFSKADEVLTIAAKGIAEVITHHYKQNIDLRDARTVLKDSGTAIMGSSSAEGENRAKEAIAKALDSPLLNDNKITGAKNVLLLIVSGKTEITIDEIGVISDYIQHEAGNNVNIIMGIGEDDQLEENISVTIIATGFPTELQRNMNHQDKKIFHSLEENKLSKKIFHQKNDDIKLNIHNNQYIKNMLNKRKIFNNQIIHQNTNSKINRIDKNIFQQSLSNYINNYKKYKKNESIITNIQELKNKDKKIFLKLKDNKTYKRIQEEVPEDLKQKIQDRKNKLKY